MIFNSMIGLYHNDMLFCAQKYQKLAIGMDELEKFHMK
jgi:hypothetical protein